MRVRVEGRRARPVEIVIDELVVDREVAADPLRLEAALAGELDRRLALEPGLAELRGRSAEMGRLVASEVAVRTGPEAARLGPEAARGTSAGGTRAAASDPWPGRPAPSRSTAPSGESSPVARPGSVPGGDA